MFRIIDWLTDGSMPWAMTKIIGACALVIGVIAAPFAYIGYQNSQAMARDFAALDKRPSVIFNSVASCTAAGYRLNACQTAFNRAVDLTGALGTTAAYSSARTCADNHQNACRAETVMVPITTMAGQTPIITYVPQTSYYPPMVAFQASRDNLQNAVPLYIGKSAGLVIRRDGQQFSAPAP